MVILTSGGSHVLRLWQGLHTILPAVSSAPTPPPPTHTHTRAHKHLHTLPPPLSTPPYQAICCSAPFHCNLHALVQPNLNQISVNWSYTCALRLKKKKLKNDSADCLLKHLSRHMFTFSRWAPSCGSANNVSSEEITLSSCLSVAKPHEEDNL